MSAVLSFAEIDGQHVELLPARTVLSLFSTGDCGCTTSAGTTSAGTTSAGATGASPGVTTGAGGPGMGKAGFFNNIIYIEDGNVSPTVIGGAGGAGGAAGSTPTGG